MFQVSFIKYIYTFGKLKVPFNLHNKFPSIAYYADLAYSSLASLFLRYLTSYPPWFILYILSLYCRFGSMY